MQQSSQSALSQHPFQGYTSVCPFGFTSKKTPQRAPLDAQQLVNQTKHFAPSALPGGAGCEKLPAQLNGEPKKVPAALCFDHVVYRLHNHNYIREMHEKYGDIFTIPIEGQDMVFCRHPAVVKRILTSEAEFTKTFADADSKSSEDVQYFKNLVQPLLKSAEIFGSSDNSSRRQALKSVFLASGVFHAGFERVLDRSIPAWPTGRVDSTALFHPLVFEMVMVIMAGENAEETAPLLLAAQDCLAHFTSRYTTPLFDEKISAEDEKFMKQVEAAAMGITNAFLVKAKQGELSESAKCSMLGVIMDCGLSAEEMNATMVNALFAACEAPIHVLGATLVEMSKRPQLQDQLLSEIRSVGHEKSPLLQKVLFEGLRLFAPVTLVQRRTITDVVADGFLIPKDTNVSVCISAVHQNEKYFARPMEFDPHRTKLGIVMLNPKQGYMPFSTGPRSCPGRYLAVTFMKCTLARLVETYVITESANSKTKKLHKFAEFPTDGAFVHFELRRPRAKL